MVYSFASASLEDCSVTTEDKNLGNNPRNHDEVACNAHLGYDLGGTIYSLSVTKTLLRVIEL